VQNPAQIEAVFTRVAEQWGSIDVLVHGLAFAGKEELIGDYSATSPRASAGPCRRAPIPWRRCAASPSPCAATGRA
jgi:NAD(P)-dependent dehydrogenase (short-subunit alcohol dehydrogenase family)